MASWDSVRGEATDAATIDRFVGRVADTEGAGLLQRVERQ